MFLINPYIYKQPQRFPSTAVPGVDIDENYVPGSGDVVYLNDINIVKNSGAEGTTDWINPTNGVAEFWTNVGDVATASIVTGNGFIGNAQRFEAASSNLMTLEFEGESLIAGNYILKLKYRASSYSIARVRSDGTIQLNGDLNANTSDALAYESGVFSYTEGVVKVQIVRAATIGNWFVVDEIEMIKQ